MAEYRVKISFSLVSLALPDRTRGKVKQELAWPVEALEDFEDMRWYRVPMAGEPTSSQVSGSK